MFNLFKKKPKAIKKLKQNKVTLDKAINFKDLVNNKISITRELDGNSILLGINIDDKKIILDNELSLLVLSVLKEYCMTNDIEQSLDVLTNKGEE